MDRAVLRCLDLKCSDVEDQTCAVHLICVYAPDQMDAGQGVADLTEDLVVQIVVDLLLALLDVVEAHKSATL